MKFPRLWLVFLALGGLLAAAPPRGGLPAWSGWRKLSSTQAQRAGWGLPGGQAAAMAEYGLRAIERDTYQRGGRRLQVEGFHFRDVAGAFGAFTYYRPDGFRALKLGPAPEQAAEGGDAVLFTRGAWLVRVRTAAGAPPGLGKVRRFAAAMPVSPDLAVELPDLPQYLPLDYRAAGSLHYSEGPAAFAASCTWLPAASVGFQLSAETALATYNLPGRPAGAQLLVISYPTPQMARTHRDELARAGGVPARRSGPFVILVHGLSAGQAKPLLDSVNYDAVLTRVPPKFLGLEGLPAFIVSVFLLCALVIGLSVVLGVITGGTSAILENFWPERFRHLHGRGLIRLHLGAGEAELNARRPGRR